jgi:dTDP-D-glucose 4,6-dehydratase
MKLLITSGSEFIVTNYVDYALSKGVESLINIDIKQPFKKEHNLYWRQCDIMDYEKLKNYFRF